MLVVRLITIKGIHTMLNDISYCKQKNSKPAVLLFSAYCSISNMAIAAPKQRQKLKNLRLYLETAQAFNNYISVNCFFLVFFFLNFRVLSSFSSFNKSKNNHSKSIVFTGRAASRFEKTSLRFQEQITKLPRKKNEVEKNKKKKFSIYFFKICVCLICT